MFWTQWKHNTNRTARQEEEEEEEGAGVERGAKKKKKKSNHFTLQMKKWPAVKYVGELLLFTF